LLSLSFFLHRSVPIRHLPSFPTRRSSDLDCLSCVIAIAMSFLFIGFGRFEGVKLGTVLCALINGRLIGKCSRFFEKHFDFVDGRSEEHTSELQSRFDLVCRLLLEKKKIQK